MAITTIKAVDYDTRSLRIVRFPGVFPGLVAFLAKLDIPDDPDMDTYPYIVKDGRLYVQDCATPTIRTMITI